MDVNPSPVDNLMNQITDNKFKVFAKKKIFSNYNDDNNKSKDDDPLLKHLKKQPKFQGLGNLAEEKPEEHVHCSEYLKLKRYNELCIKDMQNNTRYPTSCIILTCLNNSEEVNKNIGSGLTILAEDKNQSKVIVIIHDFTGDKAKFTKGVLFRIFSPHFVFVEKSLIKVSPPENLMLETEWEELSKSITFDEKRADDIKNDGNKFFESKNYESALECYSNAISILSNNPVFYSNRSMTYYHLGLYDLGLFDADKAISIDDFQKKKDDKKPENVKSFFDKPKSNLTVNSKFLHRKILNLIRLEEYEEAKRLLEENIKNLDNSKFTDEFQMKIVLVDKCIKQAKGKIDYIPFIKCYKENQNLPELATYIGDIEVQPSTVHGNGVFAKRNIKYGELLLVTKAIVFTKDESTSKNDFFLKIELSQNLKEKLLKVSSRSTFLNNKLVNLHYNKNFKDSWKRDKTTKVSIDQYKPNSLSLNLKNRNYDNNLVLSTEILNSIIELNNYIDYASISNIGNIEDSFFHKKSTNINMGTGLWFIPSFFNNSCIENASKFFVEDYMIVFANKNINKGEELMFSYFEDSTPYDKRKEIFEMKYGFVCSCSKCVFEKENTEVVKNLDNSITALKNLTIDKQEEIVKAIVNVEECLSKFGKNIELLNNYSYPLILLSYFNLLDNMNLNADDRYNDTKYKILKHICNMDNLKFYWIAKFLVMGMDIAKFDGDKPDEFKLFKDKFSEKINPLDDFVKEWMNLVK